jgi:predicted metal-dependent HD superfamily phosphohydrolase
MTTDLSARWHRLTAPLVPDATRREAEFQRLTAAYQAPTRHYHNLKHLENLLTRLDAADLQDRAVVELAVWFHDVVCNALNHNNELCGKAQPGRRVDGGVGAGPIPARTQKL